MTSLANRSSSPLRDVLYEFSMANNKEMGVLIDKNDPADTQLFEDAYKEVDYINQTSQRFELNPPKSKPTFNKNNDNQSYRQSNFPTGFCIRTGVPIPFDVEKPLSYEAYQTWSQFGDPNYPERFCHFSGEPSNGETSVNRPILKKNWKKAQETFGI